ncbi:aminoglycoside phosphotransferase family protein [Streptomyces cirratus]|uniref:aminoglycoside phosphotransferase family protein n=1 Tax=Streptomyces cirratus TaxID=68187 RepID=UPI00167C7613|nr:aminoglycoside phosphotransferase family protein [Streptomyces cirratus]
MYDEELEGISERPRILNVVGVGGIGKSRLLQELRHRTPDRYRSARLDLQLPALRQQEDALAVLRTEFGAQGVKFDRFDIAYAVLWQRVHPQLQMDRKNTPFAEESEVLSKILDDAMGLPVFGTAAGLVRLTGRAIANRQRRHRIEADSTLQELDSLSNAELGHAVTYLFAEDLRQSAQEQPFVLYVDAYEAMVPAPIPGGRSFASDAWLRDLLGQLQGGLTVLASREALPWTAYDKEWDAVIRRARVEGLPMAARLDLLNQAGITEIPRQRSIAEASAGVPFYLHLAVDTHVQNPDRTEDAGTSEEIVQRFLQHVAPDEVRILELLSIARTFDLEVFRTVGRHFDLPANLLTWESLTAYSFAYPLPLGWYRLHQLMVSALQGHLSPAVKREAHAVLRAHWEGLADRMERGAEERGVARSSPLREAVYHGLRAGNLAPDEILKHADRALRMSSRQAVDGMVKDLRDHLAASADHTEAPSSVAAIRDAADCLDAESRLELGDTGAAMALTPVRETSARSVVAARLALAGANARRIAGESALAARIFEQVWEDHSGEARTSAGLCVADIRMWQGDFQGAFALAEEVYAICSPEERVIRGDLKRLMHLGHRFLMDFARAQDLLLQAEQEYRAVDAVIGLANLRTNRAELLAFTDPEAAVAEAGVALEVQRELGAQHEIGKVYTAMAIAQIRMGQLERAELSFRNANAALDRAGYRSGRARADMFRAFLLLRRGEPEAASALLRHATREFEVCQVYPSLILAIHRATELIGLADADITAAADRARPTIRPLGAAHELEQRTEHVLSMFVEVDS